MISDRSKRKIDAVLNAIDDLYDTDDLEYQTPSRELKLTVAKSMVGPGREYAHWWINKQ